jgi:hypothetical protein
VRRLLVGAAIVAFLATSLLVARWLAADGVERGRVERLLTAQGRGDVDAMAREIDRCDGGCRRTLTALAERLRRPGELEIVRYDSRTSRALGARTAPTRVVWTLPGTLPTVQCVSVRRSGDPLSGPRVTLLALSPPIGREAGCPR